MFKVISRNVLKLAARFKRRYADTCWCPEEPFDEYTRCVYLPNGVRVVTEENSSPLTCVSLFAVAGSRYETSYNNGITHFIEHMAFKGFKSLSRTELECVILNEGARMDVRTDREMQIFSVILPSSKAQLGIEFLYKIIAELDISTTTMEQEKQQVCLELMDIDLDHKKTMFEYLHSSAFQGTPLGQSVIGSSRNLVRFDATMMSTYLNENYSTCKLIVATSGGVKHDDIVTHVTKTFGSLKASTLYEADPGPCRFTASQLMFRNDDMPLAHVAIAFEAPGYNSPDYLTMLVMSCILGSWHKSMGRPANQQFRLARRAGGANMCESYESFYIVYKDVGLWGTYFVAGKHDLDDMVLFWQSALCATAITCHSQECSRAIELAKLKVAKRYNGVVNSSRDIGIQMMYACTRQSLRMMYERLDRIKAFAIREAAEKYVYNKSPVVIGLGPTECLSDYNRIESGTYWLRW